MRKLLIAKIFLGLLLLSGGCDNNSKPPTSPTSSTTSLVGHIAAHPFPDATEVRLYINSMDIAVDEKGYVSEGSFPAKGILLTNIEMRQIQNAVYYTKPPSYAAACCVPRHAFLFYDKTHHFLGSMTVCFECSCATLEGHGITQPAHYKHIEWDENVFAQVIRAHGQSTTPQDAE